MFIKKPYFNADAGADPNGGGSTPPAPAPNPPAPEAEAKEFETLLAKEATLSEEEKTRFEALKGKFDYTPVGEDGKPLTPEELAAFKEVETKVNAILAKPEDQRTPEEIKFLEENTEEDVEEPNVYARVNELREIDEDIDYGDLDPTTPEGIAHRENVLEERAVRDFESGLAEKFPRGYQFLMHLAAGGTEEDFFKPENQDFRSVKLEPNDKKGQEKVLRDAMRAKGISPVIIDASITSLKDGAQLYEAAKAELEALQAQQAKQETEKARIVAAQKQKQEQDINSFYDVVEHSVKKGFDNIVVPQADQGPFLKFLSKHIDYHEGQFYRTKLIQPKELAKELKVAYFEFKGGDLKSVVENKAKSQQALRLKGKVVKHSITPKGGNPQKRYLGLSEV